MLLHIAHYFVLLVLVHLSKYLLFFIVLLSIKVAQDSKVHSIPSNYSCLDLLPECFLLKLAERYCTGSDKYQFEALTFC